MNVISAEQEPQQEHITEENVQCWLKEAELLLGCNIDKEIANNIRKHAKKLRSTCSASNPQAYFYIPCCVATVVDLATCKD